MERLHREKYTDGSAQPENDCIICMEHFKPGDSFTRLPCDPRHIFHTNCIEGWLSRAKKCPMCNCKITKESLQGYERKKVTCCGAYMSATIKGCAQMTV